MPRKSTDTTQATERVGRSPSQVVDMGDADLSQVAQAVLDIKDPFIRYMFAMGVDFMAQALAAAMEDNQNGPGRSVRSPRMKVPKSRSNVVTERETDEPAVK